MPELPEVETVRAGLAEAMTGRRIELVELRRADLRKPFPKGFAKRLKGRTIVNLGRRAKYLLMALDDGTEVLLHLGMSGSFRVEGETGAGTPGQFHHPRGRLEKHDHVVFRLNGGTRIVYNDPRRFGLMDIVTADPGGPIGRLGVEPLLGVLEPSLLADRFRVRRTSIKAALLDQRVVAGLGNIYVCEALWRARISPLRSAASLAPAGSSTPSAEVKRLAKAIPAVLRDAIAAGGSSLRDYARADGSLGSFQHRFDVYDRAGQRCHRRGCGGVIARVVQSGRSTFHCPVCQG